MEQIAASGSKILKNMVSLRPMRARQCAAWWSQVKLNDKSAPSHIKSSLSDSGKIYHQALVDQNTCNDPNYIARIAFNVAKIFRDPGSKITVRPGGVDICYDNSLLPSAALRMAVTGVSTPPPAISASPSSTPRTPRTRQFTTATSVTPLRPSPLLSSQFPSLRGRPGHHRHHSSLSGRLLCLLLAQEC